jgi:uncharacterized membrane-anchored protein YitT (DUF2179 family)
LYGFCSAYAVIETSLTLIKKNGMMDIQTKKFTGGVLAGLFTGILIGYLLGINQSKSDIDFLSQWTSDSGNYDDGNIFGYETGLPDNYHEKVRDKEPKRKKSKA